MSIQISTWTLKYLILNTLYWPGNPYAKRLLPCSVPRATQKLGIGQWEEQKTEKSGRKLKAIRYAIGVISYLIQIIFIF